MEAFYSLDKKELCCHLYCIKDISFCLGFFHYNSNSFFKALSHNIHNQITYGDRQHPCSTGHDPYHSGIWGSSLPCLSSSQAKTCSNHYDYRTLLQRQSLLRTPQGWRGIGTKGRRPVFRRDGRASSNGRGIDWSSCGCSSCTDSRRSVRRVPDRHRAFLRCSCRWRTRTFRSFLFIWCSS